MLFGGRLELEVYGLLGPPVVLSLWQSSEQQNSQQFTLAGDAMMENGELTL